MSRRFLSPMKCSATQAMTWSADISVITPSVQCQLCSQSEASIQVMWSFSANQKLCGQSVVIKSFLIANPVPQTPQTLKNLAIITFYSNWNIWGHLTPNPDRWDGMHHLLCRRCLRRRTGWTWPLLPRTSWPRAPRTQDPENTFY